MAGYECREVAVRSRSLAIFAWKWGLEMERAALSIGYADIARMAAQNHSVN